MEDNVKTNAQKILSKLNNSMSETISLFLTQVSLNKGIPFETKITNKFTKETLSKSENMKEFHETSDTRELFKELKN